ncbi:MAG TPA: LysM peptidoglycan-binding domain-containing protein [Pseudonocardia sp.]|nr:LysM peptidoglycan-binding domain-containing protein [Pseudonocardia sp.]
MTEPDHEKLRRELESAASRARGGARHPVTGRTALIGLLVAVPVATAVLAAVGAAAQDSPAGPGSAGALPTDAVAPQPSRPGAPRAPATATGPDLPPHPDPPPDADRPVTHTVQPGETLARIALRHGVPFEQIAAQNALADPDRIRAGQNLVIHPAPPGEVVIAPGSTLGGYAERHGTTVAHLMALNPQITDPDRIVAGGRLRVE